MMKEVEDGKESSSVRAISSHHVVVDVDHEDGEDDDDVRKPLNDPKRDDEKLTLMDKSSSPVNITSNILPPRSPPTSSIHQPAALNGNKSNNGSTGTIALKAKSSLASGSKTSPGKVSISLGVHPPGETGPQSPKIKRQSILLKRGDTDLSIDHTGLQRLLPSFMQFAFADPEAETIYREYYSNEKRSDFHILIKILLLTNIILLTLFSLTLLLPSSSSPSSSDSVTLIQSTPLVYRDIQENMIPDRTSLKQTLPMMDQQEVRSGESSDRTQIIILCIVSLTISLSLIGASGMLCSWTSTTADATKGVLSPSTSSLIWSILPVLMWIIQVVHVTCDLWLYPVPRLPSDSIYWMLLYTYIIYVIFPLRLRFCCLLSFLLSLYHVILVSTSPVQVSDFKSQLVSNLLLFICVNVLGIMSFFFYERQQRRSFLETCQSLEAKLVLEEESQEQERLLLSVLPQHVASEIREDLGSMVKGQFKKIYMSRHEHVSILFADIVGFTAISSTCSAPELVRILNELFARFDKLSDKYHQLRIKILGDCYYCISGAPVERSDHAVLCVHMGLSMVDAIQCVREETKSPVDMRVGIHTGGLLAGVMGQKQWQFDVYSKDVELANKMESGGVPGKVHISEKTYSYLDGEFEVIDGDGASREEAIRLAGIKTYLVTKVLKEYPEGTLDEHKMSSNIPSPRQSIKSMSMPQSGSVVQQQQQQQQQIDGSHMEDGNQESDPIIGPGGEIINVEEYNKRLLHELLNRESGKSVRKNSNTFTLGFSDGNYEHQWKYIKDITSCISLLGLPISCITISLVFLFIGPFKWVIFVTQLLNNSILVIISIIVCSIALKSCLVPCDSLLSMPSCVKISELVQSKTIIRLLILFLMIILWIITHVTTAYFCPDSISVNQNFVGNSGYLNQSMSQTSLLLSSSQLQHQFRHHHHPTLSSKEYIVDSEFVSPLFRSMKRRRSIESPSIEYFHQVTSNDYNDGSDYRTTCHHASYLTFFTILGMIAVTVITRVSFVFKKLLIICLMVSQVLLNLLRLNTSLDHFDQVWYKSPSSNSGGSRVTDADDGSSKTSKDFFGSSSGDGSNSGHGDSSYYLIAHSHLLNIMIIVAAIVLSVLNRQFELMSRRLFLWQKQVEEQKEKVSDIRKKNEALVYNILPPHVAIHFLGRRNLRDEELYSKSYDSVGVLFAAMPNFSDFYTEESVNNQGLECLRFLNEVISDYDALLEQERFNDVIKIKTIGSTYMAASGLNVDDDDHDQDEMFKKNESSIERLNKWRHLVQLTEFALSLKETLNNINKESFNNFVLRIGINCGPITAGVIGARKPHYDMWGNTVNVASRMESTGKAGSIQVVQETRDLLQEFGYEFEQRGMVSVKGKGMLRTFYLISGPKH